jgi:hypothetical protein
MPQVIDEIEFGCLMQTKEKVLHTILDAHWDPDTACPPEF